jgi:hypothetical protein
LAQKISILSLCSRRDSNPGSTDATRLQCQPIWLHERLLGHFIFMPRNRNHTSEFWGGGYGESDDQSPRIWGTKITFSVVSSAPAHIANVLSFILRYVANVIMGQTFRFHFQVLLRPTR